MKTLEGLVEINGRDIWKDFGVFLTEEKKGGRENLNAIMRPSKVKPNVGVDIREHDGVKYSADLAPRNSERDVTLHFALYAPTREEWLRRYRDFIRFLKAGDSGWLRVTFAELGLTLRMFYVDCGGYTSLSYLWREGVQAARFKVQFREPEPTF